MTSLTNTTLVNQLKEFIIENFLFGDSSYDLTSEASLIENDIIDSTGVMELVLFLEDELRLEITDEDIIPANLDSIDKIVAFITRKKASTQSAA